MQFGHLNGSIPDMFDKLPAIYNIQLNNNFFTGTVPESILDRFQASNKSSPPPNSFVDVSFNYLGGTISEKWCTIADTVDTFRVASINLGPPQKNQFISGFIPDCLQNATNHSWFPKDDKRTFLQGFQLLPGPPNWARDFGANSGYPIQVRRDMYIKSSDYANKWKYSSSGGLIVDRTGAKPAVLRLNVSYLPPILDHETKKSPWRIGLCTESSGCTAPDDRGHRIALNADKNLTETNWMLIPPDALLCDYSTGENCFDKEEERGEVDVYLPSAIEWSAPALPDFLGPSDVTVLYYGDNFQPPAPVPACKATTLFSNMDSPGHDLQQFSNVSVMQCGESCCNTTSCVAFVYVAGGVAFGSCSEGTPCCLHKTSEGVLMTAKGHLYGDVTRTTPPSAPYAFGVTGYTSQAVIYYEPKPKMLNATPTQVRKWGCVTITMHGDDFVDTGSDFFKCEFRRVNGTSEVLQGRPEYVSKEQVTCHFPDFHDDAREVGAEYTVHFTPNNGSDWTQNPSSLQIYDLCNVSIAIPQLPGGQECDDGCDGGQHYCPCGSAGECLENQTTKQLYCECNEGFNGSNCEICVDHYYGITCEACPFCEPHGVCDDGKLGSGKCQCDQWYMGSTCDFHYFWIVISGIIVGSLLMIVVPLVCFRKKIADRWNTEGWRCFLCRCCRSKSGGPTERQRLVRGGVQDGR